MSQVIIQFQNPDEVVEFTNTVERSHITWIFSRGSNSVADAKSPAGDYSALGLGKPVETANIQ